MIHNKKNSEVEKPLNHLKEEKISRKDVIAIIIATLQFVLPIFLIIVVGLAFFLVLFQWIY